MVYLAKFNLGEPMGISIIRAAKLWGAEVQTVRKWYKNKKLIKKLNLKFDVLEGGKYEPISIPAEEIQRVKKLLKPRKEWRSGQSLFKD